MARLAAAKGWFLSSGGSKGSLSSGHTCVEQSNNYNDRVCSEREVSIHSVEQETPGYQGKGKT